jgi:hypothetical protein
VAIIDSNGDLHDGLERQALSYISTIAQLVRAMGGVDLTMFGCMNMPATGQYRAWVQVPLVEMYDSKILAVLLEPNNRNTLITKYFVNAEIR